MSIERLSTEDAQLALAAWWRAAESGQGPAARCGRYQVPGEGPPARPRRDWGP